MSLVVWFVLLVVCVSSVVGCRLLLLLVVWSVLLGDVLAGCLLLCGVACVFDCWLLCVWVVCLMGVDCGLLLVCYLLGVGCWLLLVCYLLDAVGYWSLVVGCTSSFCCWYHLPKSLLCYCSFHYCDVLLC